MKERTDTFIYRPSGAEFEYFTEDAILYDIETTGLSPRRDQVYCIGCCTRQGENVTFRQFFAETPMEEEAVLSAFADLLSRYPVCITFNGMRFDEPFLRTRLKQYKKTTAFPARHIDLYKNCLSMKRLLALPSLKQKSIERFLGIDRQDRFGGGELIEVYHTYTRTKEEELLRLLLLHNEEDVRYMVPLLRVLSYRALSKAEVRVSSCQVAGHTALDGSNAEELLIEGRLPFSLPAPVRIQERFGYLILENDRIKGSLPLLTGTLSHYLPDFRRYVYLPDEDMVVLKEMAGAIPAERKEKATADNCRLKKEGRFLLLPPGLSVTSDLPLFQTERKEKQQYVLYTEETIDPLFLSRYLSAVLHACC